MDVPLKYRKIAESSPWIRCNKFAKALEERDQIAVNALLDTGFDIDTYLIHRKTAISICVLNELYDMARLLVRRGCSLSLKTENGETPLHIAVHKSNFDLVKLLLEYRADVTSIDLLHKTALHYACQMNNLKIAALLIKNATSAALNVLDKDNRSSLFYACQYGCYSMISTLISKGAKVNLIDSQGNTPLHHALVNPQCTTDIVRVLVDAGADVNHSNVSNEPPLIIALRMCPSKSTSTYKNFLDVCLLLIEYGCDPNTTNYSSPLHLAIDLREEILVRKLLNFGCNANAANYNGIAPLYYACAKGCEEIAKILLDAGANFRYFTQHLKLWSYRGFRERNEPTLVMQVQKELKKCPLLSNLCRTVIRRELPRNIEKSASLLPLPLFLIRFIQLY